MFGRRAVQIINAHPREAAEPLFLYLALQSASAPWQAPEEAKALIDELYVVARPDEALAQLSMSSVVDKVIANVTRALQARNMWGNALLVVTSDAGADLGADPYANYPLRGFKGGQHEGGVVLTRDIRTLEPNQTVAAVRPPSLCA